MKWILVLTLCFAGNVVADSVNKCTDADGNVAYQAGPCAGGADTDTVEVDNTPDPGYVAPTYPRYEDPRESTVDKVEEAQRRYSQRRNEIMDEYYEQKCERYKGYLKDTEDKWDRIRRQGYQQWEKDHYELLIQKREREVELACR